MRIQKGDRISFRDIVYDVLDVTDQEVLVEMDATDDLGRKIKRPQWVAIDAVQLVKTRKREQANREQKPVVNMEFGIVPDDNDVS